MRKFFAIMFILSFAGLSYAQTKLVETPVAAPVKILKNYMDFLYYSRDYLRLVDDDYKAYDDIGKMISKRDFLDKIATGKYLPLRLNAKIETYQLYDLPHWADKDIAGTVAQTGKQYADEYKREGKKFPAYSFIDLNGKVYTPANTLGKIVVLKCWFLACTACREEIPALNELTDQYKNRKDIIFVSLVFDKPTETKAFLSKTKFNYAVVTNKKAFMEKTLSVTMYPTHFIINKQRYIVKMVNDPGELVAALNKVAVN